MENITYKKNISLDCMKFQYGGGMERYVVELVNGFHQRAIKPTIFATKFNEELAEYQFINPIKVNLSFVPKPLRNLFLSYLFNRKKQQNNLSMTTVYTLSDIVICGGNHLGYLEAMRKDTSKQASKQASLTDKLKIANEQKSLTNSKLVIAHSKMMANELVKYYNVDNNKVSVIYPPVDIHKFTLPESNNKRQTLRRNFGFSDEEIIYLFPSTGHRRKGFDILKQYFEKSDLPIKLVVAGTPVKESKNIKSLGYCKNMQELYQAADYTVMASIYEPFGLVGIESILSGTPIIFSENMGCLEVLKNDFGYTFSRENINTLDHAINESFKKAQAAEHRIDNPFDCINYDPSLLSHIEKLLENISLL
ncbi:glycosyltransferase family 4 protein [Rodentibacter heidelbergensis]|uniref:Glycosyl transferase family 1 n=1 Tax=Rodentibacter heidelbergensis TaxID=1908258 RepID=A0A1V3I7X3_9PAST|nr:glycosyltransferase family 4 protein [Rodentibacter heidelbergensis]OOF35813.1 hypothetical protein BKK48_08615 [Rodentibacter heidelbergensis]